MIDNNLEFCIPFNILLAFPSGLEKSYTYLVSNIPVNNIIYASVSHENCVLTSN